jgi:hypothetical protein
MLLPFGALTAHHNRPNTALFNPDLGWTLGAGCDPLQVGKHQQPPASDADVSLVLPNTCFSPLMLQGWPHQDVQAAGRRHGVPPNDLYGVQEAPSLCSCAAPILLGALLVVRPAWLPQQLVQGLLSFPAQHP